MSLTLPPSRSRTDGLLLFGRRPLQSNVPPAFSAARFCSAEVRLRDDPRHLTPFSAHDNGRTVLHVVDVPVELRLEFLKAHLLFWHLWYPWSSRFYRLVVPFGQSLPGGTLSINVEAESRGRACRSTTRGEPGRAPRRRWAPACFRTRARRREPGRRNGTDPSPGWAPGLPTIETGATVRGGGPGRRPRHLPASRGVAARGRRVREVANGVVVALCCTGACVVELRGGGGRRVRPAAGAMLTKTASPAGRSGSGAPKRPSAGLPEKTPAAPSWSMPSSSGSRRTASSPGWVAQPPALWREVEPDSTLGYGGKRGQGGGAERTPAGRGSVCPGLVDTTQAHRPTRGNPNSPLTARGTQGLQEEPLCNAS